jgi:hypothetical protein
MEWAHRCFNAIPWLPSRQKNAPGSHLATKSHGLHSFNLCKACNDLDLGTLVHQPSHIHLQNCFELVKTSQKCRFCAFIAQTLRSSRTRELRSVLVSYDILPSLNVPMCLRLRDGRLEVTIGERHTVRFEIYSGSGRLL